MSEVKSLWESKPSDDFRVKSQFVYFGNRVE